MIRKKETTINDNRQAIAGIQKHFATTATLVLDGAPTTTKDVVATLQAAIDAIDAAGVAEKAFHDRVAAQHAAILKANAALKALKALVKSQLGSTEAVMGDFGFTVTTRKQPDETTKAEAVKKRAATRAARHTMGKRQKAKVKGQAQTQTPPAAPATPSTPNKPA